MRDLIWVFSIVLALIFLITGVSRALRYQQTRKFFAWVNDVPRPLVQVIGFVEILGALGLILPVATGIYPWLTLVAAGALALLLIWQSSFTRSGMRGRRSARRFSFC